MDQVTEKAMYDNADKFIDLANEMSKTENYGTIGVAIRYAAARYSALKHHCEQIIWRWTRKNTYSFLQIPLQKCYRKTLRNI